jgi:subtilisin family serine protease
MSSPHPFPQVDTHWESVKPARFLLLLLSCTLAFSSMALAQGGREVGGNAAARKKSQSNIYIVQLAEAPVVAYAGEIAGFAATKPANGSKIDPLDPKVVRYGAYLESRHAAVLNSVGGGRKLYSYKYSFNGFAAELDAAKAARLQRMQGVLSVSHDQVLQADTVSTPEFLGLSTPGGVWEKLGGVKNAGEGVIIGIVDSGIWPESLSFSDRDKDGKLVFHQIPGWHGKCTPGEKFNASMCNQKLIGAQWFNQGWGGAAGIKAQFPSEFVSVRDAEGHGTHTASTAGGNNGVDASADGISLGQVSGMAPRARIAAYKVCWSTGGNCSALSSDSVAAIDQAVADGVDVINFSISGSLTSFLDPVEVAFLYAARAGVFVAASAGNSGPGNFTVAHNSPWLTTVAASSHDRVFLASAVLGNSLSYEGYSLTAAVPSSPLVYGLDVKLGAADATEAQLCFNGTLDPAKVAGKIVVCDRGVNARTDKSLAVKQAGGVGMILVNTSPNSLNADLHYVPTVHLPDTAYAAVRGYAQTSGSTARLTAGQKVPGAVAPVMASFSSRGPSLASADLLKPDITAPGVDVLASVSPYNDNGRNFDFFSGTSMSSPHMAGIAALMKQRFPSWTPAMIKSALMTTASQTNNVGGTIPGGPFAYGAGHVTAGKALVSGLVYDSGWNDWLAFLCGTGQLTASYCPSIAKDPSDLNYPSVAVGSLAGVQVITRKVTNMGPAATYTSSLQVPTGFSGVVTPDVLNLASGQTKSYTITLTRTTATMNSYLSGSITWGDGGVRSFRSPIVVRPVPLKAPAEITSTGAPIVYNVRFGYTGAFGATPAGLIPATKTVDTVADDPDDNFDPVNGSGWKKYDISIPAGTTLARFALFNEFTDGEDDLDLYVYKGTTLVGASGGGTAAERVDLVNPVAGVYSVYVHGWQTDGPSAVFTLFHWLVGSAPEGNMSVSAPASAVLGGTGSISVNFTGLSPATRYLGTVPYTGLPATFPATIVSVDTP